jgi:hypothetical protein
MEEGKRRPAAAKVSVIAGTGIGPRDRALLQRNGYGIYYGKVSAFKKKCKGFPMFFTFKNFQTALMGDLKLWTSRHYRRRRRRRRYRRSRSNVAKKRNDANGKIVRNGERR